VGKLFNSGLNFVEVATSVQRAVAATIATTPSPTKGNVVSVAAKSLFLVDAAVVQKAVASPSVASSPIPDFDLAPISTLSVVDVTAAGLKAKLNNLDLSLKDNTQSQFPVAVSSLSSLSSKAPITDPAPVCISF
jgi:hypothetical protein